MAMPRLKKEDLAHPAALTDSMTCPICFEIFQDPVFACGKPCQHVFCRSCVRPCLEAQSKCPTCRQAMKFKNMQRHQQIQSLVDEMQVVCPCKCGWMGRSDSRKNHMENCSLASLKKEVKNLDLSLEENRKKKLDLEQKANKLRVELALLEKACKTIDAERATLTTKQQTALAKWEAATQDRKVAKRPMPTTTAVIPASVPAIPADPAAKRRRLDLSVAHQHVPALPSGGPPLVARRRLLPRLPGFPLADW